MIYNIPQCVYAPVLPGYDGSSFPPWMVDVEDVATLVIDFLDTLKLERPLLIGHSLGGWIAAEVAVFRPDSLAGLALIAPLGVALFGKEVLPAIREV